MFQPFQLGIRLHGDVKKSVVSVVPAVSAKVVWVAGE